MEPEEITAVPEETAAETMENAAQEARVENLEIDTGAESAEKQEVYIPVRRERRAPKKKHTALCVLGVLLIFLAGVFCGYQLSGVNVTLSMTLAVEDRKEETEPGYEAESQETEEESQETEESTEETAEESIQQPAPLPWNLILVNPWNEMPEDFEIELAEIPNGRKVDVRCYDDLMDMVDAMKQEGLSPVFRSGYRTMYDQQCLFENKVNYYLGQGYSQAGAEAEAATVVAIPGTSEHQLGLAVDIVDDSYWTLDEKQESTPVQQWLIAHSWEYGFILRYPNGATEITGIIYEPWHYRYVGVEAAEEIHRLGVTLEEYLELKFPQE